MSASRNRAAAFAAFAALAAGVLFGVGLCVSGMARPSKVLGFLTLGSDWDPSLLFVMAGAISVHALAYRFQRRRAVPFAAGEFSVPPRRAVSAKVLAGAAVFGVGWGLSGFCPGPSIVSLPAGAVGTLLFVSMFFVGSFVAGKLTGSQRDLPSGTETVAPFIAPSVGDG